MYPGSWGKAPDQVLNAGTEGKENLPRTNRRHQKETRYNERKPGQRRPQRERTRIVFTNLKGEDGLRIVFAIQGNILTPERIHHQTLKRRQKGAIGNVQHAA